MDDLLITLFVFVLGIAVGYCIRPPAYNHNEEVGNILLGEEDIDQIFPPGSVYDSKY